jgi:DNA repair exonuclease SbcCD ATPase subunit
MKQKAYKYGKTAAAAVVGVGLGAGGAYSQVDSGPSENQVQELEDRAQELQSEKQELDSRPSQEVVDDLRKTVREKNEKIDSLFSQDEVDEVVAEATERESLVDYLPVVADEEVELEAVGARADESASESNLNDYVTESADYDAVELEDDFDEVRARYVHEDGHEYYAVVRVFEDAGSVEEYENELRQAVQLEDYYEVVGEDVRVIRDGYTVVYLRGDADTDEPGYDFDSVAEQY